MVNHSLAGASHPIIGMTVTRANTKHPSFNDMPRCPGDAKAHIPAPTNSATPPSTVAGVDRAATRHPAIMELPQPRSHVYQQPPAHVVAADDKGLKRRPE